MKTSVHYALDANLKEGIMKLINWLQKKERDDYTGTVSKSLEILSYIVIREYYTQNEKELLNELRAQYFTDTKSK